MYVCMHVCMYVWIYVCMYVWMDVWMDGWMDGWMYIRRWVGGPDFIGERSSTCSSRVWTTATATLSSAIGRTKHGGGVVNQLFTCPRMFPQSS